MAKNIEFSAEEMSELHAFYTMEVEKAELRLKAIKSIIAKIGSAPQKSVSSNILDSKKDEPKQSIETVRKIGRPAKVKVLDSEPKISKRKGRPLKVKSDSVVQDTVTIDVINVSKKRGPKPGSKYKKSIVRKTRVAKTPKLNIAKPELIQSVSDISKVLAPVTSVSPKKRGPKPGTKYKKSTVSKTRLSKTPALKVSKSEAIQSVNDVSKVVAPVTSVSPKKRGPKPGSKYKKSTVIKTRVAKSPKPSVAKLSKILPGSTDLNASITNIKETSQKRGPKPGTKYKKRSVDNDKVTTTGKISSSTDISVPIVEKTKLAKSTKTAKKVQVVKSSDKTVKSDIKKVSSELTNVKLGKISAKKIVKTKDDKSGKVGGVKVLKAKENKITAVKVNNVSSKLPSVKVKTPSKVVTKSASKVNTSVTKS